MPAGSPGFVHELACVHGAAIGDGTRVWQYAVVMAGAHIGAGCNICAHVVIEGDVVIGDNVTVKSGVQLWNGTRLESDVFIGPNATFTNDPFPRSGHRRASYPITTVRRGASVGANATILPGVEIGAGAMVGAGAVVTRSVPPNAIVLGNPATVVSYTDAGQRPAAVAPGPPPNDAGRQQLLPGIALQRLPVLSDIRGSLAVIEFSRDLPFTPARYFIVFDVPSRETRGEHAHRECEQVLACLRGSCRVVIDNGTQRLEVALDEPGLALHLPAMTWTTQYKFSPDAMLAVFASHPYDPGDYIRDYGDFIREVTR